MANPVILSLSVDVVANQLSVSVQRERVDSLTGLTELDVRHVTGPLNTLAGLGALRTNVAAWVKAQTGFTGAVDVSTPPAPPAP